MPSGSATRESGSATASSARAPSEPAPEFGTRTAQPTRHRARSRVTRPTPSTPGTSGPPAPRPRARGDPDLDRVQRSVAGRDQGRFPLSCGGSIRRTSGGSRTARRRPPHRPVPGRYHRGPHSARISSSEPTMTSRSWPRSWSSRSRRGGRRSAGPRPARPAPSQQLQRQHGADRGVVERDPAAPGRDPHDQLVVFAELAMVVPDRIVCARIRPAWYTPSARSLSWSSSAQHLDRLVPVVVHAERVRVRPHDVLDLVGDRPGPSPPRCPDAELHRVRHRRAVRQQLDAPAHFGEVVLNTSTISGAAPRGPSATSASTTTWETFVCGKSGRAAGRSAGCRCRRSSHAFDLLLLR